MHCICDTMNAHSCNDAWMHSRGLQMETQTQNTVRVHRGVQILKIVGIGETVWSVRDMDGGRRDDIGTFATLKSAKAFIDAELDAIGIVTPTTIRCKKTKTATGETRWQARFGRYVGSDLDAWSADVDRVKNAARESIFRATGTFVEFERIVVVEQTVNEAIVRIK